MSFSSAACFCRALVGIGVSLVVSAAIAQTSTQRHEGLRDNTPQFHAITGATLVVAPGRVIQNGTLVIKDGRITAVGAALPPPAGARVWAMPGRTVYAGFVDLASNLGVPANLKAPAPNVGEFDFQSGPPPASPPPQLPPRATASANRSVRSDLDVAALLEIKPDDVRAVRELGFTAVLTASDGGVLRGQGALLTTADARDARTLVMKARATHHIGIDPERTFTSPYPNSRMGAVALVRQTLSDARWYNAAHADPRQRVERNASLEALRGTLSGEQRVVFDAASEQDYPVLSRIANEFSIKPIYKGNGFEYRRLAVAKALNAPIIVPVNFPAPPEVEVADLAADVALHQLQHWEEAPTNAARLADAGVPFTITASGLRDSKEFWPNVRLAVAHKLAEGEALAALTTRPAEVLGLSAQMGTLEVGKLANVVVAQGNLFADAQSEIELTFVDGRPHATAAFDRADVRGTWQVDGDTEPWTIAGTRAQPTLTRGGQSCMVSLRGRHLAVNFPCGKADGAKALVQAELIGERLVGSTSAVGASTAAWQAKRIAPPATAMASAKPVEPVPVRVATYPAGEMGMVTPAQPAAVLIKNATVWTSGKAGKLDRADVLVRGGRIAQVGPNISAADAVTIDATGKHLTPGLIDAHSHTAVLGGINESSSSITAEVRIGDVIDATDINIYRQLAGGVTAANVLHGSANTIGGQSQVIKLRWGSDAEGLKFSAATPGIKFALGENVKQSNFQMSGSRYPQTRLGVEQLLRDAFRAAREYQRAWAAHRSNREAVPEPRRDLQLETLAEILDRKRVVHIHSYRADEILMFARLAKELGIKVGSFQHVLEGYKVADAIAEIGAGGSTFSDWWAYKMEAFDAIPANAALMHRAGVVTTLNSDSNELARRLNTEAAKAVRYGNVSEEDAIKFVTLNAAIQLGSADRHGSLEAGKDADFVIWSAHPLSTQALAEQTWIDGRKYFDRADDQKLRAEAASERARLLAKALPARLARLRAAPAASPGERPATEATPSLKEFFEYAALQRELHAAKQYRGDYWDGGQWHECTEDAR